MAEIIPRWEWRTWGADFGSAEGMLNALEPELVHESDEIYLLSPESNASVKVRDGQIDVKRLEQVNDDGLEQWRPVLKAGFPLPVADVRFVLDALDVPAPELDRGAYTLEELAGLALPAPVHKRRVHYRIDGCMAEVSELRSGEAHTRTLAVEGEDAEQVIATVRRLGLDDRRNVSVARGLKTLLGIGSKRFAVVDVGTNSVKLHVAESAPDGTWRTLADRGEVTRLGEGLHASGRLSEPAVARTVDTIAAMVSEARALDVAAVAAVGTAGLRIAENAGDLIEAVRDRTGIEVEVIPGEEEARMAFLAATAGLRTTAGALVVFDTGGGSSQFTVGGQGRIGEQFSVNVGAVRLTEAFGLDRAVGADVVAAARASVAEELSRLAGRPVPGAVVGMGGANTNLAAVKHALATYDPNVVQGTVLYRGDIDEQIERYRTRDAEQRASIVGLQANRAAVILAGACIVRTVLDVLGADALMVSDRALRHGLMAERFAT